MDAQVWRHVPDHDTMTVGQFNFEPNSVLRSSIVDQSDGTDPKNDDLGLSQEA